MSQESNQQRETDSSQFIICRAAAGSGKTFTLVSQYLRLAFSAHERELGKRFGRILAITFTNKATNEMKERILRELDSMATHGIASDMSKHLAQQLGIDDSDTLKRRAAMVRAAILHNYSDFAVSTIDSFMHRLVRTFAHDLGLSVNFDVYIEEDELIQNAVDELMMLVGSEGQAELTQVVCEYADSRMAEGKGYMVERDLADLAKELFKERTPEYLKDLSHINMDQFRSISSEMHRANRAYEEQLKALGLEGLEVMRQAGLSVGDFYRGSTGVGAYFAKVAEGANTDPNSYVMEFIEGEKLWGSKATPQTKRAVEEVKPLMCEAFRRLQAFRQTEGTRYSTRRMLLKNLYALALINKMNELVGQYAQENEIVHISEFNKRIGEVVQSEPTPFIYERIGNRYWNYLIDEFQDTSRMQWQNLVPLLENGVGSGHTSLVVGDGKQAIYRFRQGDVGQFVALPHVDNALHGRLLEHPGISAESRLECNYRSAGEIVEFNNRFFEWAVRNGYGDNEMLQKIYIGTGEDAALRQTAVKKGGYVQVGFWQLENDHTPLWERMLEDIRRLTEEQGYELRDMTILARDKRTLAELSAYLTSEGVPVVSNESFLLSQSRLAMLMKNLLQYLLDGSDRVAAMRVLLYLKSLGKIGRLHTEEFAKGPQGVDLDAIARQEGLALSCSLLRQLGLYDCCEEALRMLDLGSSETAYAATWLNMVARYATRHRQDLGEFLEWFDKQKDKVSTTSDDDLNAVRLMTIHKAKGLEAPIVLYPILNRREKKDKIWVHIDEEDHMELPASLITPSKGEHTLFDKECEEEEQMVEMDKMNVLYVALTRPREKLMVYCQKPPEKGKVVRYSTLLKEFMEQLDEKREVEPDVYAVGEDTPKKQPSGGQEKGPGRQSVRMASVAFPRWTNRIAIAEQAAKIFGEMDETYIVRGNQMHEILSLVHHQGDIDKALDQYFAHHHLNDEEGGSLAEAVRRMMAEKEVARFFRAEDMSKNECSLVWRGEVLRPDRIVFTKEETWVVDFKTGMPKAEHRAQVQHYCEAIKAMGHPGVSGYLIYIGSDSSQVLPC